MKKLLLPIFLICVICGSGCATEYNIATGREDIILIETEREINIGRRIAERIEQDPEIKLENDLLVVDRVRRIGKTIAEVCDRKELNYYFNVIEDEEVNAFALPGGYLFVNSGLIKIVENDDELAGVLAHEISHVVAKHSIKRLQAVLGYDLLRIIAAASGTSNELKRGVDIAFHELVLSYSREDETLADKLAIKYLKRAGYNPHFMLTFLKKLQDVHRKAPIRPLRRSRTHPYISERIRAVKQEISGEIEFTDYLNKPIE